MLKAYLSDKQRRGHQPGWVFALPVPNGAWQTISMHFLRGWPKKAKKSCW